MKTVKAINIFVICAWVLLISILIYNNFIGVEFKNHAIVSESFDRKTHRYDLYMGAHRTGSAVTQIEKAGSEIIITQERSMTVKKDGEKTVLNERLKLLTDQYYALKSFEYIKSFGEKEDSRVSGELDEGMVLFFLETETKRKTYKVSTESKDLFFPISLIPAIHQKSPAPHAEYNAQTLNLATLAIDEIGVELEEVRPFKVGSDVGSLHRYRAGKSVYWVSDRGVILKEEHPSGVTFYYRNHDAAPEGSGSILVDYTSLPFFKSDMFFPNSIDLKRLKLRLHGFSIDPQLFDNSYVTMKDDILTITKAGEEDIREMTYALPETDKRLKKYLGEDAWVLSDYKPLRDTGLTYARVQKYDAHRLAYYLSHYVYGIIKTSPLFLISDSRGILEQSLRGDFLERTVMYATYARAGGMPTRLVGGLVYLKGYFYYHTWPEVWFGKWVPVDPTLFQFPADVTHIPLKEGTLKDIVLIIDQLKNVKIEVLEAS